MKGFTLFEIIIVVSIIVIIIAVSLPVSLSFLKQQNVGTATSNVISTLRQAHTQSMFQKNDSSFGIKFLEGSYVLFQGSSYSTRTTSEDIVVPIPSNVTISGIDEIVFTKRTGLPSTTGTLLVMSGTISRSIYINQQGIIEL